MMTYDMIMTFVLLLYIKADRIKFIIDNKTQNSVSNPISIHNFLMIKLFLKA